MFETEVVELFPKAPKNDKIALIDADTVAFAACSVHEYEYYDIDAGEDKWDINLDTALEHATEKVYQILDSTGCQKAELYFTSGMNFRYTVDPSYKSNRIGMRKPAGLTELKVKLLESFDGQICLNWEADDMVAYLKRTNPDKYILCAVDKDVLYSLPGEHFNYYSNEKYKIFPKFEEVNEYDAMIYNFKQAIMGDANDGIPGIKGIGKAKAAKLFGPNLTPYQAWLVVKREYERAGMNALDALVTMQLVSMHQLVEDEGELKIDFFNPFKLEGAENEGD